MGDKEAFCNKITWAAIQQLWVCTEDYLFISKWSNIVLPRISSKKFR